MPAAVASKTAPLVLIHGDDDLGVSRRAKELYQQWCAELGGMDHEIVQAGARAYADRGCYGCHGAPGVDWEKFSEGLRPDPPYLKEVVEKREPRELFWVVANGIKMTGMPAFGLAGVSDPELWAIIAFLKKLPSVSPDEFKAWVDANPAP